MRAYRETSFNYFSADTRLGKRNSVKVANNTYLIRIEENKIGLRLHNTYVVIFTPDYTELNTGGWQSMTTKNRMEYAEYIRVSGTKHGWMVFLRGEGWETGGHPYYDGIRISPDHESLLDEQPKNPKRFSPVYTERGF